MKKILVTGGSGILGSELKKLLPNAIYPTKKELDLSCIFEDYDILKKYRPDCIIHLAAITSIRECESDKSLAWEINVGGTVRLLNLIYRINPNCKFVYVSSACVFDGDGLAKCEVDIPNPKNFYGFTKAVAETIVRAHPLPNTIVIRTNFAKRGKWKYPKAYTDRYGTYLFADQVAKGIYDLIKEKRHGVFHLTGKDRISMYELACMNDKKVKPTTTEENDIPLTRDMSLRSIRLKPGDIHE